MKDRKKGQADGMKVLKVIVIALISILMVPIAIVIGPALYYETVFTKAHEQAQAKADGNK